MRLSEAILLGDSLKKGTNQSWLSPDGSCGCAFGGALLAAGANPVTFNTEASELWRNTSFSLSDRYDFVAETATVQRLWPWITTKHLGQITELYSHVRAGVATIEEVADYARSVEPAEPSSEDVNAVRLPDVSGNELCGERTQNTLSSDRQLSHK